MARERKSTRGAGDGLPRLTSTDEWNDGVYDKRIGGAEYYKPGTPGRENPTRLARSYFVINIRDHAPQVLDDLGRMRGSLHRVYQAEQEWWDLLPKDQKGSSDDIKVPVRACTTHWIYDYFVQVRDGNVWSLDEHERQLNLVGVSRVKALREFVNGLRLWADRYHLANWMVEDFITVLEHYDRQRFLPREEPEFDIRCFVMSPGQASCYPFRAEREEHRYRMFASRVGEAPNPVSVAAQVRATKDGPNGEWVVVDDPNMSSYREFVFRFEGYDPTMMTRARFNRFIMHAFKEAVQAYADRLEQDLEGAGFVTCPRVFNTKMFKMAVERIVLGRSPEEVARENHCDLKTVEKAITRVKKWIDYEPDNLPRKQRVRKKIGRKLRG